MFDRDSSSPHERHWAGSVLAIGCWLVNLHVWPISRFKITCCCLESEEVGQGRTVFFYISFGFSILSGDHMLCR